MTKKRLTNAQKARLKKSIECRQQQAAEKRKSNENLDQVDNVTRRKRLYKWPIQTNKIKQKKTIITKIIFQVNSNSTLQAAACMSLPETKIFVFSDLENLEKLEWAFFCQKNKKLYASSCLSKPT